MDKERQLDAIRRLLHEGQQGGQAKVDALIAMSQRTVFVVPWTHGIEGLRTLINSSGSAALPAFTDQDELEIAATRYGWRNPDGTAVAHEVGVRQAFRYAMDHGLAYVVIDIAADHALEVSRDEIEPLLTPASRRDSTGPFAGAGSVQSSLHRAVRPTPTPPKNPSELVRKHTRPPAPLATMGMSKSVAPGSRETRLGSESMSTEAEAMQTDEMQRLTPVSRTGPQAVSSAKTTGEALSASGQYGLDSSETTRPTQPVEGSGSMGIVLPSLPLRALPSPMPDALLDQIAAVLRLFPEVEWACMGSLERGPAVGLRIDPKLRARVTEIAKQIGAVSQASIHAIVVLDEPEHYRAARSDAEMFYPWRRR